MAAYRASLSPPGNGFLHYLMILLLQLAHEVAEPWITDDIIPDIISVSTATFSRVYTA